MRFERIYRLAPIFLQNVMVSTYGRKIYSERYGGEYRKWLDYYVNKDYSNIEIERKYQLHELRKLISYSIKYSPFYSRLYSGITVANISSIADVAQLPIVDKETFRKELEEFYTVSKRECIESFTGGTTGKSLLIRYTKGDFQKKIACLDAFRMRSGIEDLFNAKKATFSGRSICVGIFQKRSGSYWRDNNAYNQRLYSTFDMKTENLLLYVENLNRFRPDLINGFVSAIHQLSRFVLDNNLEFAFKPKAIFTTSETLLPHHRASIEQAFGARLFDQYGSAEGAPFITECKAGNLHYNLDTGVIETEPDGGMLITSFFSQGTPLIRYRIGDSVRFAGAAGDCSKNCDCGSCHPVVERIEGREVDYLFSPERGRVSLSHLADVIKGIPDGVIEMQFVQNHPRKIEILMNVDRDRFREREEAKILGAMEYRFGAGVEFMLRYVDRVEKTQGGKLPLIVNNVDGELTKF